MSRVAEIRIAVVGDHQPERPTHRATTSAIAHAADRLGCRASVTWVATDAMERCAEAESLLDFHGVWVAPGSPYRSLEGALRAIAAARNGGMALLGTCAGFQHIVLEYARSVLAIGDAQHAEYDGADGPLFITPLSCSVSERTFTVAVVPGTRAALAYGASTASERYYCNFGLNPDRRCELEGAGLVVSGTDLDGEARIVELPSHRFFLGTLFVPQMSSFAERPHPLVVAFMEVARHSGRAFEDRV